MPFEMLIPPKRFSANIAPVRSRTVLSAFAFVSVALKLGCHRLLRNRVCNALSKIEGARRLEGTCGKHPRRGKTVIRIH